MSANETIRSYLIAQGIHIMGFADLSSIPAPNRENFPFGIVFGIPYSREGMLENMLGNPKKCSDEYFEQNRRMAKIATGLAHELVDLGFKASAKTYTSVAYDKDLRTVLPYKTVARLAGLGWIGKCALLVSEAYGAALRMSVVLTNAALECGNPVTDSGCPHDCMTCTDICPGNAVSGKLWEQTMDRDDFFDAAACETAATNRAQTLLGLDESICGLCMSNCPFTRRVLSY